MFATLGKEVRCEGCGKTFEAKRQQKFCSSTCRSRTNSQQKKEAVRRINEGSRGGSTPIPEKSATLRNVPIGYLEPARTFKVIVPDPPPPSPGKGNSYAALASGDEAATETGAVNSSRPRISRHQAWEHPKFSPALPSRAMTPAGPSVDAAVPEHGNLITVTLREGLDLFQQFLAFMKGGNFSSDEFRLIKCKEEGCDAYSSLCDQCEAHLFELRGLVIWKSAIRYGGIGLFAGKDFGVSETIGVYTGHTYSEENFQKLENIKRQKHFAFKATKEGRQSGADKVIVASDSRHNVVRYINTLSQDQRQHGEFNCTFHEVSGEIRVQTTKKIKAGEEFFVNYGTGF